MRFYFWLNLVLFLTTPTDTGTAWCVGGGLCSKILKYPEWGRVDPNPTQPNQTRHNQTRPDQTRPDQTRPDQTRPDQTRPDHGRHFLKQQTEPHFQDLFFTKFLQLARIVVWHPLRLRDSTRMLRIKSVWSIQPFAVTITEHFSKKKKVFESGSYPGGGVGPTLGKMVSDHH